MSQMPEKIRVQTVIITLWILLPALGSYASFAGVAKNVVVRSPLPDTLSVSQLELSRTIRNPRERSKAEYSLYSSLKAQRKIPFLAGDTAIFQYYGAAEKVCWAGDFNGWNPTDDYCAKKQEGDSLFLLKVRFPSDARLDYKLVIDGKDWILDPANPKVQMSGFGPNSELQMPGYHFPSEVNPLPGITKGQLGPNRIIHSRKDFLGYDVQYRLYTPAGYPDTGPLPVIYVTDGPEFADSLRGCMITVLDNLIAAGKIQPLLAVFIDPTVPDHPEQNRRMQEYAANPAFTFFLCEELVPAIDSTWLTLMDAGHRMILGTSMGGWCAAYTAISRPDLFQLAGIFSPALDEEIIRKYHDSPRLPLQIFMGTGVIHDAEAKARGLAKVLEEKGYPLKYVEVNQGHSWGNWKGLLAPMLQYFFAPGR